jgi:hypothetical protein
MPVLHTSKQYYMIDVFSNTKIYVACPSNRMSGGIESLHQVARKLRNLGFNAKMVLYPDVSNPTIQQAYKKYKPVTTDNIEDAAHNILIVPETFIHPLLDHFQHVRKIIWWLSTENFIVKTKKGQPGLDWILERPFLNLVQSAHTRNFLHTNNVAVHGYLSGHINSVFLKEAGKEFKKTSNNIIYNPIKGFEFTAKIMEAMSRSVWTPIKNMTPLQIKKVLAVSKVYVDFGNHPGRDRLPREATMMKCCVITGKRGTAALDEDVPIPAEFKFDESTTDIKCIVEKIETCLTDYDNQIKRFVPFYETVQKEEERQVMDLKKIFVKQKKVVAL